MSVVLNRAVEKAKKVIGNLEFSMADLKTSLISIYSRGRGMKFLRKPFFFLQAGERPG